MRSLILASVTLLLMSCASVKPGPDAFDSAQRAIDAAVKAGAEEHAPTELRFARDKLGYAHQGMDQKKYEVSLYLIEESEINSELAIEKSRTALERRKVNELTRSNEELKARLEREFGESFE